MSTEYRIRITECDQCMDSYIADYTGQILSGVRDIGVDPKTLTADELREAALDEMGDGFGVIWLQDDSSEGLDFDTALVFVSPLAAAMVAHAQMAQSSCQCLYEVI